MADDAKVKITIQFPTRTIDIIVDEKDAFSALDYLLGRGMTTITSQVTPPTPAFTEKTELKVPERSLLVSYIKSQPDYVYSIDDIVKHFTGRSRSDLKSSGELRFLNAFQAKLLRIRYEIEQAENGEWITEHRDGHKVYRFIKANEDLKTYRLTKDSEDEVKQSTRVGEERQLTVESY